MAYHIPEWLEEAAPISSDPLWAMLANEGEALPEHDARLIEADQIRQSCMMYDDEAITDASEVKSARVISGLLVRVIKRVHLTMRSDMSAGPKGVATLVRMGISYEEAVDMIYP